MVRWFVVAALMLPGLASAALIDLSGTGRVVPMTMGAMEPVKINRLVPKPTGVKIHVIDAIEKNLGGARHK